MKYVSKRLLSMTLAVFMAGSVIPSAALASSVNVSDSVSAGTVSEAQPTLSISDIEYQLPDNNNATGTGTTDTVENSIINAVKSKTLVNGSTYSSSSGITVNYSYSGIVSGTTPVESGKYTVTASIPADSSKGWSAVSKTAKLTIYPKNDDISIKANDVAPTSTGNTISIPYTGKEINAAAYAKGFTKDDFEYSSQKGSGNQVDSMPTNAGTYTIRAKMKTSSITAPEKSQSVTISKANLVFSTTGTQSGGIYGSSENGSKPYSYAYTGNKVNPEITAVLNKGTASETNVSDKISYTYKQYKDYSSSNEGTKETTPHTGLPTECGKYEITATLSNDTANWDTTSSTSTIQKLIVIEKKSPVIGNDTSQNKPTHADGSAITYQNDAYQFNYTGKQIDFKANAVLGTSKFTGTVKYKYADSYAPDSEYISGLPSARGSYRVLAYIDATGEYEAARQTFQVYISSSQASITMPTQTEFYYTGKPVDYKASSNIGEKISYKYQKVDDTTWTEGLPADIGTYNIEATLAKTADHSNAFETARITIKKAKPVITVADKTEEYTGSEIPVTASSTLGKPIIKYKPVSAADSEYTTTAPKAIGTYDVKAYVEESDNYEAASKNVKLTIKEKALDIQWTTDCDGVCTDNGSVHTASPSIKSGIVSGEDVSVSTSGNKQSKAGTYALVAELKGANAKNYTIKSGEKYSFVISSHKHVFSGTKTVTPASPDKDGKITTKCSVKGCTQTKSEVIARPAKVTLSKSTYVYSGKNKNPKIRVTDSDGSVISASNYSVSYPTGRSSIGKHTVTVTFNGKNYKGSMSAYFTVKPSTPKITSLKSGKGSLTVKFSARSGISGYKIEYSDSSDFSDYKTLSVSAKSSSATISKLSSGKTYYVRISAYAKVSGKSYYSAKSAVKSAKVK